MTLYVLINVGTSYLQHEYLIDKLAQDCVDHSPIIYLLYGRPLGGNNPLVAVNKLKVYAESKNFKTECLQIDEPVDLEKCKEEYKRIVRDYILSKLSDEDKVIVSMAGGTNPMLFSMFLAVMNYLPINKVEFVYVEGQSNTSKDQLKLHRLPIIPIENIMNELKSYSYHKASYLATMLPDTSEYIFIKSAIKGLLYWESFNYEDALDEFNKIRKYAELLQEQGKYDNLPDTIIRLHTEFSKIRSEYKKLKVITNSPEKLLDNFDDRSIIDLMSSLIADMLLNASRRFIEGLYTDCIVRCYRALEMCIQMLLLLNKINPWYVSKDSLPDKVKDKFNDGDKLSLYQALQCLSLDEDLKKKILDIQQARNNSILAHGFIIQNRDNTERVLALTTTIIDYLLSTKDICLKDILNKLAYKFSDLEVSLLWKRMNR